MINYVFMVVGCVISVGGLLADRLDTVMQGTILFSIGYLGYKIDELSGEHDRR